MVSFFSDFPGLRVSLRNMEKNQHEAIVKVKSEISGIFEFYCTALNEHGFDTKKITLTVVGKRYFFSFKFIVINVYRRLDDLSLVLKFFYS